MLPTGYATVVTCKVDGPEVNVHVNLDAWSLTAEAIWTVGPQHRCPSDPKCLLRRVVNGILNVICWNHKLGTVLLISIQGSESYPPPQKNMIGQGTAELWSNTSGSQLNCFFGLNDFVMSEHVFGW